MNKYLKGEFKRRIYNINNAMGSKWEIKSRNISEELANKGLLNSGVSIKMRISLIQTIVKDALLELDNMIDEYRVKFSIKIPPKELNIILENEKVLLIGTVKNFYKDIKEISNSFPEIGDNYENNIIQNISGELKNISEKNNNINRFTKIEWVVIVNTIATVGGFVIAIISLIITLNGRG